MRVVKAFAMEDYEIDELKTKIKTEKEKLTKALHQVETITSDIKSSKSNN